MFKHVKIILAVIFYSISLHGFAQGPVIADPATGPISITTFADVAIVPSQVVIQDPVLIKVPIYNKNLFNEVPGGSMFFKIGLGSKMILQPGYILASAPLSEYFTWNSYVAGGQTVIEGELIASLPPDFSGMAIFPVVPNMLNASSITANVLVTNHVPDVILSDENGANNTATLPYFIIKKSQTITFNPLANKTYGDPIFPLTGTASSGLGVSYTSSDGSVATVSGNVVTITGVGTTSITASQAGNGIYYAAPQVVQTLTVTTKELTVTGVVPNNKTYDGTTAATLDLSGATLQGVVGSDIVTLTGTGTFADPNAGTGIAVSTMLVLGGPRAYNYTLVQPLFLTADITKADQTITFNALPDKTTGDVPFTLTATSTSGLAVSFASSDPLVATISGTTLTIQGAGSTIITASQGGNGNYNPAPDVQQTQVVNSLLTLNLKMYLEGFYDISTGLMRTTLFDLGMNPLSTATDSVTVNLWSPSNLSSPVPDHSVFVLLHNNGTVSMTFPGTLGGNAFYIAIKHRNTVETWSASPVLMSAVTNYDFTDNIGKAYGDGFNPPMKAITGGIFGFYSGDINQDGSINGDDMNYVDNDSQLGYFGEYRLSDLNGDQGTDGADMNIVDNNSVLGIFYARPF